MNIVVGKKKGMTRVYVDEKSFPVTIVDISDCVIARIAKGGFELGAGKKKGTKLESGRYVELNYVPFKTVFVNGELGDEKVGQSIDLKDWNDGDKIVVTGISKGKGFAGVVKRHGFAGGPKTHGQSDRWRAPGAIGAGTTPGRIVKGKRMAGRMGSERVTLTTKLLQKQEGILLVRGPIPGPRDSYAVIKLDK